MNEAAINGLQLLVHGTEGSANDTEKNWRTQVTHIINAVEEIKRAICLRLVLAVIPLLLVTNAVAQSSSPLSGSTPSGLTPGAPAGSYSLSGFDNVNLFNGNLNFRLPLLTVSGRGGASVPIVLPIEKHWHVESFGEGPTMLRDATDGWWSGVMRDYGPGLLLGRTGGYPVNRCFLSPSQVEDIYITALTRLTFTAPDGTEYELRDQLTGGQPKNTSGCLSFPITGFNRGRIFVSADGTSATFTSTSDIIDDPRADAPVWAPSGDLMLRDGTLYHIVGGLIRWTRDRNGNRISFTYSDGSDGFQRLIKVTDSLNREVTIAYDVQEGSPYGRCDRITYKGFGGASRIVRVSRDRLVNLLRTTQPGDDGQTKTYHELFPELSGTSTNTHYNPRFTSAVWLPDGRAYKFFYNAYGELARVELPTGGAFEYDHDGGMNNITASGVFPPPPIQEGDYIYRRVVQRRVYSNGTTLEGRTLFSKPETYVPLPLGWRIDIEAVQVDSVDPSNGTVLTRQKHYFHGAPSDRYYEPSPITYPPWRFGREDKTEAVDPSGGAALRRIEYNWDQTAVSWWLPPNLPEGSPGNNPRIVDTVSTLVDTNQVAKQHFEYDQYNNRTVVDEFDAGAGSSSAFPIRRTETDYVTTNELNGIDYTGANIHLRGLTKEQRIYSVNPSNGTKTLAASAHFYYDQYGLLDRPGIIGLDTAYTTALVTRGNPTSTVRWLSTGGSPTTSQHYDIAGHVVETVDALGNSSQFEFSGAFGAYGYATKMRTPVPDPSGVSGSTLRQETNYDYDYDTGMLKSVTDPNGATTTANYIDSLDRLYSVVQPGGGQTIYTYGDTPGNLFARSQTSQNSSQTLEGTQFFDGLGRGVRTALSEGSTATLTDKQYDAAGRVSRVSNPYRAGDEILWTTSQYDVLSRIRTVTKPNGSQISTTYSGNSVTATDEAGKTRKSTSDALGRMILVVEDPGDQTHLNYEASYTYDALGKMRKVTQGNQVRYFMYDSLGRLIRARNPEQNTNVNLPALTDPVTGNSQWSLGLSYDNNNNLTSRTDARNITCNYAYDALNRKTTQGYVNDPGQTPSAQHKYDGAGMAIPNALGKLTSTTTSGSFTSTYSYDAFDAMGRVLHSAQTTDGQSYGMSYGYDLAGHLISETYPSNRVVTKTYDAAGRLNSVSSGAKVYADSFSYAPHGAVTDMRLGNNLWEHATFDSRSLQPTEIGLGSAPGATDKLKLNYDYGTTADNGNVRSQTITVPGGPTVTQNYSYDALNRLRVADENSGASWKQTFIYDRYGNRSVDLSNTTPGLQGPNPQISPATNRITNRSGESYSYDSEGNLLTDTAGHSYTYDAENMQVKYDNGVGGYFYDGDGRRVKTVTNGQTTVFVYDAMGNLVAEYATQGATGAGTSYLTSDALGSPRIITGENQSQPVKARHDYLPFGEEINAPVGGRAAAQGYTQDVVRQKFTGKQRDAETGLDYFGARYYSSAAGRFTSADSTGGGGVNPQTLNLYTYVLNNPLVLVDPTGHYAERDFLSQASQWEMRVEEEYATLVRERNEEAQAALKEMEDPVPAGMAKIDKIMANGGSGRLVFYQAGIFNDKLADTDEAVGAISDNQWVKPDEVVPSTNNHGLFEAKGSIPNQQAAENLAYLIQYALSKKAKPDQITIVAHSNGVPTLHAALQMISPKVKFREIILFAPATKSTDTIGDIASRSHRTNIVSSTTDLAAGTVSPGGQGPTAWRRSLDEAGLRGVVVTSVLSASHSVRSHVDQIKQGMSKELY